MSDSLGLERLMRECYVAGRDTERSQDCMPFPMWWEEHGQAKAHHYLNYYSSKAPQLDKSVGWSEYHRLHAKLDSILKDLKDVHGGVPHMVQGLVAVGGMVEENNAMLKHMTEAMQKMEPDEVIAKDGDLWTLTAHRPDHHMGDDPLHYTVVCHGLMAATTAAAKAWGHGGWDTLRRRTAAMED